MVGWMLFAGSGLAGAAAVTGSIGEEQAVADKMVTSATATKLTRRTVLLLTRVGMSV
jgi:hypothetical protein